MTNLCKISGTVFCLLLLAGHAQAQDILSTQSIPLEDSIPHALKHAYWLDSIPLKDSLLRGIHEKQYSTKVWPDKSTLEKKGSGKSGTLTDSLIRKGTAFIPPWVSRNPLPSGYSGNISKHMGAVQGGLQKSPSLPTSIQKYTEHIDAEGNNFDKAALLGEYQQNANRHMVSIERYKSMSDSLAAIDKDGLDTMLIQQTAGLAEKVENRLASHKELEPLGESDPFETSFEKMKTEAALLQDADFQRLELKKIQKDHFSNHAVVKQGISDMRKMKGRYKEIKDSRFLKEGTTKRHSLGDYPFFSRLEWGIHLNIRSFAPPEGEALPSVGFRMDRRWVLGIGPVFSGDIGRGKGPQKEARPVSLSGYRSYTLFTVREGIFLQGEYQGRRHPFPLDLMRQTYRHTLYGGIGTEFRLFGNFKVRSTVLYCINKKQPVRAGPGSPWQASMGIINYKK